MLILAAVPDRLARRLAASAPDWVQLRVANSWTDTTKAVRHTNVEVGVFDPALEGGRRFIRSSVSKGCSHLSRF